MGCRCHGGSRYLLIPCLQASETPAIHGVSTLKPFARLCSKFRDIKTMTLTRYFDRHRETKALETLFFQCDQQKAKALMNTTMNDFFVTPRNANLAVEALNEFIVAHRDEFSTGEIVELFDALDSFEPIAELDREEAEPLN